MRAGAAVCLALLVATSGCIGAVEDTFQTIANEASDVLPGGPSNRWALDMIQATSLHKEGTNGEGVKVAVVDTGVRATHPEFQEVSIGWYDAVNGRAEPYDNNGHGTHVSGLAVAGENPGAPDVVGAAPGASLLHLKAVAQDGQAEPENVEEAIRKATANGAHVIVLSLGERARVVEVNRELEDAVRDAIEKGVVVVAAAGNAQEGNSGENCSVPSPANMKHVIAVGAVDRNKDIARFSCSGPESGPAGLQQNEHPHRKPELSAPGVKVAGPWPARPCAGKAEARFCFLSGTSQATPFVGGVVAMMLQENPDLKRKNRQAVTHIKEAFRQTAEKPGFSGHHDRYGYGIVQAADAIEWLENNEMEGGGTGPLPPPGPGFAS